MPQYIVLRFYPDQPVNGASFTNFLTGLSINVLNRSYDNPSGVLIGTASAANIVQHVWQETKPPKKKHWSSVATAVIEVPAAVANVPLDLKVLVYRNGQQLWAYDWHVNPATLTATAALAPASYATLPTVSAYLALPAPAQMLEPPGAHIELTNDATPPSFDALERAIALAVAQNPAATPNLAALTPAQCLDLAYLITWDHALYTMPVLTFAPPVSLEVMYTLDYVYPPGGTSAPTRNAGDAPQAVAIFRSSLTTQQRNAATRLSQYIYAYSAALACETASKTATAALIQIPTHTAAHPQPGKIAAVDIGIAFTPAPLLSFGVPAAYFYALTAALPTSQGPAARYQQVLGDDPQTNLDALENAVQAGTINAANGKFIPPGGTAAETVNPAQAAHRLLALGGEQGTLVAAVDTPATTSLVRAWLAFNTSEDIADFWAAAVANPGGSELAGQLEFVLKVVTENRSTLMNTILGIPVSTVDQLAEFTENDWMAFFIGATPASHPVMAAFVTASGPLVNRVLLLSPNLMPGAADGERVMAFIGILRQFYPVTRVAVPVPAPSPVPTPQLPVSQTDPFQQFSAAYGGIAGTPYTYSTGLNALAQAAISAVAKEDTCILEWLTKAVRTLHDLSEVAGSVPQELRFSIIEALYARGFTSKAAIAKLSLAEFSTALTGSVAFAYAEQILQRAGGTAQGPAPIQEPFRPINPDGLLTNCVPPAQLSPLGPVAYLHEMLRASAASTCANPIPDTGAANPTLGVLLTSRRGPLGNLAVTASNLETPIPLVDIVNECLEAMVAASGADGVVPPASTHGVVHDTALTALDGHKLRPPGAPDAGDPELHDPITMLGALAEHSSPAAPVAAPAAYAKLRQDFSAPNLPYARALDLNRSYLEHVGTSRFEALRCFQKDIREFLLDPDPAQEPTGFEPHLRRKPYRTALFCEYLGISAEEYATLFTSATIPPSNLYGYPAVTPPTSAWVQAVCQVPEFLERTGLSYCELTELREALGERFRINGVLRGQQAPPCEPCCLQDYYLEIAGGTTAEALRMLAIFIRLWRKLQALPGGGYSFAELRDICDVLGLYDATTGAVNPDFIRQLAAFQMLRDDLHLPLTDKDDQGAPTNPIDADRTHLLALWKGASARKYDWAVGTLLHGLQGYAERHHGCDRRQPEFIKLLRSNLDRLAALCGVEPWDKKPTHTLRFAEVLAKIYASQFSVGEILFIFTNEAHLQGDDPFALASVQETHDSPLQLPDDEEHFSLLALRRKLLAVAPNDDDVHAWTWTRIDTSLRQDFGYAPPSSGSDPLTDLGRHFFPSILRNEGHAVPAGSSQYRVPLANQSAPMWNTPLHGPFRYDSGSFELWSQLPIKDEAVLTKLGRLRQLSAPERAALSDLYFSPRVELARFAFIFQNFAEAERKLIQEEDEDARWAFFQREFARCHERCLVIAKHLAQHGARLRGDKEHHDEKHHGRTALAWKLLQHLLADENKALSTWENDFGHAPSVIWPQPGGGAFAALLGLAGTGLVGEFRVSGGSQVVWRELRGGMHVFSATRNHWNAPVPTVIPAMDLTISQDAELFTSVRNGLGFGNANGQQLGGLQAFSVTWKGSLLIECEGCYQFWAGGPTEADELPKPAGGSCRWRLTLKRGQKEWVYLGHRWQAEEVDAFCSQSVTLQRGVYRLEIEFEQPPPEFSRHEDVCPQTTGFQVKYKGPDTDECIATLPFERLFQERKNQQLSNSLGLTGQASVFLDSLHTGSLREMRNTYQRALKGFVFADRFNLSAKGISDDGQSEIGYMLDHPAQFAGAAYYPGSVGSAYQQHLADFDFNLLPVSDIYNPEFDYTPAVAFFDERNLTATSVPAASRKRPEALFATWERIFDYGVLRRLARHAPERTAWLLFHEAAENHPNDPDQLLWHIGIDVSHHQAVLNYFGSFALTTAHLEDERWPIRIARANQFIEGVKAHFLTKDIRHAKPDLWAADDPDDPATPGNANLTEFVHDGSFENEEPQRYQHIQLLNDDLRERARAALVAFLCIMNRVTRPDGTIVNEARHLSETLLLDVEVGLCEKASRIEEAITAIQLYVQRARLGLEPALTPGPEFLLVWDRHFQTFRTWEACKRRDIYRENWIEWDELEQARKSEAFRFLEDRLRGASLTSPAPGGAIHWPPKPLPAHDAIALLQNKEPSTLQRLQPKREGFELLGTPERQARPSWLARLDAPAANSPAPPAGRECPPLWIEAANRLGTRFVRVAAAGVPPASLDICAPTGHTGCCAECGKTHEPCIDEYYFWLVDTRHFTETAATEPYLDPLWDWHDPIQLPGLLQWSSKPMVHLMWCKVHNGERQQVRRSSEGVRIGSGTPDLTFMGRTGDSFRFEVAGGAAPVGYPSAPAPGFRYDMATDSAVVLPQLASAAPPTGLSSYPFFLYFAPGASLYPQSCFSPSLAVGDHLRAHCSFEEALKWYEHAYAPLQRNNYWMKSRKLGTPQSPATASHCGDSTDVADAAVFAERAVALRYIETLVQWADSLMCRNSPEAFQQARLILDTATRILGDMPRTIIEHVDVPKAPMTVAGFTPHFAPLNPRLVSAYETVQDRLLLIHSCLNRRRLRSGVPNTDMPYWGNSALRDGWKTTVNVCEDDGCCAPCRPYRFTVLIKQAQDLANEVKGQGSALLAAYEKGDAESLASLREVHANQLQALTLSIQQNQWFNNEWQVQALRKTKEATQLRRTYNNNLFIAGLIQLENQHRTRSITAMNWRLASNTTEVVSSALRYTPDTYTGQNNFLHLPVGSKLADIGSALARAFGAVSDYLGAKASLDLTDAGWVRRAVEWQHQVQVLDIELQQIEDQILGAERNRDISLRQLDNHRRQMEQLQETLDFLRDKFTNGALYSWMQKETAALYHRTYELALHAAYSAQRAFNNECGHTARSFIPQDIWDNLHEGLLAGDRLQLALKQMEKAYYDENCREYELSKHVSLRLHAPFAFLQLKSTGSCEVDLPEWLFDHDYPGQYMRRIRSVSLTLPCVVGPYVGVHCRLTLLSSATRVDPRLSDEGEACCTEQPGCDAGYLAKTDDARIVRQYSAVEAIATSNGQTDSGLFELNFRDERYLPFELAGAVSRWRIELPPETNYFDLDSLNDVVFHLNYTAREGGAGLRAAAHCEAEQHLPGNGLLLLDARHDFPTAWHVFSDAEDCDCRYLEVRLSRRMFPFVPRNPSLQIGDIHIFYETACVIASRHQCIELLDPESAKHCPPHPGCKPEKIECVASEEWPTLFHGVIAGRERSLDSNCDLHLGSLRFPREVPPVGRIYMIVHYVRREAVLCAA